MSDSVIQVTIKDTMTDNFVLSCSIVDDDGNQVNKSLSFGTGLKWEKIADNFLDTNNIRSVVELKGTLFAFAASKNEKMIALYSSTDAINWNNRQIQYHGLTGFLIQ